jgi:hypothetical protein
MFISSFGHQERNKEKAKGCAKNLQNDFLRILPAILPIFRHYRDKLLGENPSKHVDIEEITEKFELLLEARFAGQNVMQNFPIRTQSQEGTVLQNANEDALLSALWEIVKNAFREDKVSVPELKQFQERGEPYLQVNAGRALLNGKEVVVIEIRDRGTPINVPAIIEKMGSLLTGWGSRDITFGEILDRLSERHLSIPLKTADGREGKISTGIGLHSARSIIRKHNGEMFPVNLENGVSFLVVIPVDGKGSDWTVSGTKVTGAECGEMSTRVSDCQTQVRSQIGLSSANFAAIEIIEEQRLAA